MNQSIKAALQNDNLVVSCKQLRNQGVHTWRGLLGYVEKQRSEGHYTLETHNVSDAELQAGIDFYALHAQTAAVKGRKPLCPTSIIAVAAPYAKTKMGVRNLNTITLAKVVVEMSRTGAWYPSGQWLGGAGRGLDQGRAAAVWNMMMQRMATTLANVYLVFFSSPPPADAAVAAAAPGPVSGRAAAAAAPTPFAASAAAAAPAAPWDSAPAAAFHHNVCMTIRGAQQGRAAARSNCIFVPQYCSGDIVMLGSCTSFHYSACCQHCLAGSLLLCEALHSTAAHLDLVSLRAKNACHTDTAGSCALWGMPF